MGGVYRRVALAAGVSIGAAACATGSALARDGSQPNTSYVIPAIEIVGFEAGLNLVDRRLFPDGTFDVTWSSIRRNLRGPWVIDEDEFEVNQFLHPYQGNVYHTIARSSGLNYWQSFAYTFAGSALWEIAGETTPPSKNDQIASGIAGTFFGEAMFRAANLLIDKADNRPGPGRMFLVTLLSPATGVNRTIFGDRFDYVMPTHHPLYDARMEFGVAGFRRDGDARFRLRQDETVLDLSLEYGLPGQAGYRYTRPFDAYSLRATASTESGLESVTSRGLRGPWLRCRRQRARCLGSLRRLRIPVAAALSHLEHGLCRRHDGALGAAWRRPPDHRLGRRRFRGGANAPGWGR